MILVVRLRAATVGDGSPLCGSVRRERSALAGNVADGAARVRHIYSPVGMRRRANRFLHVSLLAPVAVLGAVTFAPLAHAQAAGAPQPYVIAIDPGHGGSADNNHPDQLFDPGAIGVNGLLEKDVTLDVGLKLRDLLAADHVSVVMTRNDDRYVGIEARSQIANDAHAGLFVSIHLNSFTDPAIGGSLVLYPSTSSQPFAQTLSDALGRDLAPAGLSNGGIQLRDNWWIHLNMPAATVEGAYLTNPNEAALLATEPFRQQLAAAIRDGLLAADPAIKQRGAAMAAWESAQRRAGAALSSTTGSSLAATQPQAALGGLLRVLALLLTAVALVRWRREAVALASVTCRVGIGLSRFVNNRYYMRRRRLAVRARALERRSERDARPHSVYDELWF